MCIMFTKKFIQIQLGAPFKPSLDLTTLKRCVVQNIEKHSAKFEKILLLMDKKSSDSSKCCLKGSWYDTEVKIGEVVSVQGVWSEERQMFIVTSAEGLIVTSPDTLMNCTRIVGSLFCARKSVLAERFQPVDLGDTKIVSINLHFQI